MCGEVIGTDVTLIATSLERAPDAPLTVREFGNGLVTDA